MLWFNFGRWNSAAGRIWKRQRIYINGYKWTPLVWVTPRYLH